MHHHSQHPLRYLWGVHGPNQPRTQLHWDTEGATCAGWRPLLTARTVVLCSPSLYWIQWTAAKHECFVHSTLSHPRTGRMRGFLPPHDFQTFTKSTASNRVSRLNAHLKHADMQRSAEPCWIHIEEMVINIQHHSCFFVPSNTYACRKIMRSFGVENRSWNLLLQTLLSITLQVMGYLRLKPAEST